MFLEVSTIKKREMALFWKVSLASENEWKITESILILFKKLVTKGFKR